MDNVYRYFLEVAYRGTHYSGFQIQDNANTIQAEVEKALAVLHRRPIELTSSSRTDAGVHSMQNFFHFDTKLIIDSKSIYRLNAILPPDICIRSINKVNNIFHCRFDALSREYKYFIYFKKNPFLRDIAYYYPYSLNKSILDKAAEIVKYNYDFKSFSKRNTQVKTFSCTIEESEWFNENDSLVYYVKSNRFLRGMIRALVGTMLKTAREALTIEDFIKILENRSTISADFSAPAHGLFLIKVNYPIHVLSMI